VCSYDSLAVSEGVKASPAAAQSAAYAGPARLAPSASASGPVPAGVTVLPTSAYRGRALLARGHPNTPRSERRRLSAPGDRPPRQDHGSGSR
jgi:hypothetical protein